METSRTYVVSFGDSNKFSVPFNGSRDDFEKSQQLRQIKTTVYDYVKKFYTAADCSQVLNVEVEELKDSESYPLLDAAGMEKLKEDALCQIKVKLDIDRLDANARFDQINS